MILAKIVDNLVLMVQEEVDPPDFNLKFTRYEQSVRCF